MLLFCSYASDPHFSSIPRHWRAHSTLETALIVFSSLIFILVFCIPHSLNDLLFCDLDEDNGDTVTLLSGVVSTSTSKAAIGFEVTPKGLITAVIARTSNKYIISVMPENVTAARGRPVLGTTKSVNLLSKWEVSWP